MAIVAPIRAKTKAKSPGQETYPDKSARGELTLIAGTVDDCGRSGTTTGTPSRRRAATAAGPRRGDTTRVANKKSSGRGRKFKLTLKKTAGELTLMAGTVDDCGRSETTTGTPSRRRAATAAGPRSGGTTRRINEKLSNRDRKIKLTLMETAGELTLMAGTVDDYGRSGTTTGTPSRRRVATAAGPRRGDATRGTNKKPSGRDRKIKLTLMKPRVNLP